MPHRQRVTIKDVAAAAGVSATTVSHVLNGKGRVEESTRQRVVDAAGRLRYRPNPMARGTRSGVSHLLGLVVPTLAARDAWSRTTNEFYSDLALAMSSAAAARGYSVVLVPADLPQPDVGHLLCDGVVFPNPEAGDRLMTALRSWEVPTVALNPPAPMFDDGWWVGLNIQGALDTLLGHLWDVGARRIAFATATPNRPAMHEINDTYARWCTERGLHPVRVTLLTADGSECPDGAGTLRNLLRSNEAPDAIATFGHSADARALRIATEAGRDVPGDLCIASLVDTDLTRSSQPLITALVPPIKRYAELAVDLLLTRLEGGPDQVPPHDIERPNAEIAVRASTIRT